MASVSRRVIAPPLDPAPFGPLTLSAVGHLVALVMVFVASAWWSHRETTKIYVVNLVPALASPATPAPTVAPRREPAEPLRPREATPPERVASKESPRPAPKPPPADFAIPRRGAKETPNLTPPRPERPPEPPREVARQIAPPRESPLPPPVPLPRGPQDGAVSTGGVVGLDVSDFPFTWYLRQIQQKVSERWRAPITGTTPGSRSVVLFEIQRDGRIRHPIVEQTSGDALFDQSALRAIMEAGPFPPLPQEFKASSLRVHFGFLPGDQG